MDEDNIAVSTEGSQREAFLEESSSLETPQRTFNDDAPSASNEAGAGAAAPAEGVSGEESLSAPSSKYAAAKQAYREKVEGLERERGEWQKKYETLLTQLPSNAHNGAPGPRVLDPSLGAPTGAINAGAGRSEEPLPVDPLPNFTIEELKAEALKFRSLGEHVTADRVLDAVMIKQEIAHRQAPRREQEVFSRAWEQVRRETLDAYKDLRDSKTPLFKEASGLLDDPKWAPLLRGHPLGVRAAAEVGELRLRAARAEKAEKELQSAQAEVKRLTGLTALQGSRPSNLKEPKWEDLTLEEQLAKLKADAGD